LKPPRSKERNINYEPELPPPLGPLRPPPDFPSRGSPSKIYFESIDKLPRITIVTPSYNQSEFLETTIRSVLEQGYPKLDFHVIDGGSTDNSIDIIKYYEPWLTSWVSESDSGQVDAILKGLSVASGEWFNWINSDDLLGPGALWELASAGDSDLYAGCTQNFRDDALEHRRISRSITEHDLVRAPMDRRCIWHQPGIWFRTDNLRKVGIDPSLHYRFDFDLLIRYVRDFPRVEYSNNTLAWFRKHINSKTVSKREAFDVESIQILRRISANTAESKIHLDATEALKCLEWSNAVRKALEQNPRSRLRRLFFISRETLRTPGAWRWRASRKALLRALTR